MENTNDAPRHTGGLMSIISRRASNAANAIRGSDLAYDADVPSHQPHAGHHYLPYGRNRDREDTSNSRTRRGEREQSIPGAWGAREHPGPAGAIAATAGAPVVSATGAFAGMLRRRRSGDVDATSGHGGATGSVANALSNRRTVGGQSGMPNPAAASGGGGSSIGQTVKIRLVPHLESTRSLRFDPISRELKPGDPALRIGRFTDRHNTPANANRLAFKSKVVSRGHAEIWLESGKFYIKDTKSSSGTFLNHQRLAPPSQESKPHALKDGDILQLGVDFQGGAEDIYKCVKIRVEIGREWQKASNAFNSQAMKTLRALSGATADPDPAVNIANLKKGKAKSGGDCCICLFGLQICQAIFIAPCSHSFHYKCIRPLLESHHPGFTCPLCRTFADLCEDVEVEEEDIEEEEEEQIVEEVTHLAVGHALGGNTLNGREGGLSASATTRAISNVNALGIVSSSSSAPVAASTTAAENMAPPARGGSTSHATITPQANPSTTTTSTGARNPFEESTTSLVAEAEADAEMYDHRNVASPISPVGGDVTDAEFAMPSRRQETGLTLRSDSVAVPAGPEESHFSDHPAYNGEAMEVDQEAEEQAMRDGAGDLGLGGEDAEEGRDSFDVSISRGRNSEEIVNRVVDVAANGNGSQTLLVEDGSWDRTYIPEEGTTSGPGFGLGTTTESPRSSQEGNRASGSNSGSGSNSNSTHQAPQAESSAAATAQASISQPNLLPQSPQSPSIRTRLMRVPSLTSPYLASGLSNQSSPTTSARQKRRSLSRFSIGGNPGALSENEAVTGVLGGGFFGSLLGRKRGTSMSIAAGSINPSSPTNANPPTNVDANPSEMGEGGNGAVGEKRKR